jgi:predicted Zn-dependent protease with MMP-like domain
LELDLAVKEGIAVFQLRRVGAFLEGLFEEQLVKQIPDPVAARVAGTDEHVQVLQRIAERARTQVVAPSALEVPHELLGDFEVVVVGRRLAHEELQVVEGADDRTARDGGDDVDLPQQADLGHARDHADVEERGSHAAAGERKADPVAGACRAHPQPPL